MPGQPIDFLRGTLDLLVLKTLSWGPSHGYAIARWIEQCTNDAFAVEEGSLYPALYRLEEQGLITADWGVTDKKRRAKFYRLTTAGKQELKTSQAYWQRYTGAVSKVLVTSPQGA
jgi:transcriptional regulator